MPIADNPDEWMNKREEGNIPKQGERKDVDQGPRLILAGHSVNDYHLLRAALVGIGGLTSSGSIRQLCSDALRHTPPDGAPE
jgi:hypothetical protein